MYDNYATDWCKWTLMAIRSLCNRYSSFSGWNLMLDETGGPNVGPFYCGGLGTRNYTDGSLSYSGQYKAFKHFSKLNRESVVHPLKFDRSERKMFGFPNNPQIFTEGCIIKNTAEDVLVLSNPSKEKEQLQFFYDNKWWYIEMLPNTAATVVFENNAMCL